MGGEALLLRRLLEGTAPHRSEEFFHALVRNLALAVYSACAFVAEFADAR